MFGNKQTSAGVLQNRIPRQPFTKTAALLVSQTAPHTSYQVYPRGVPGNVSLCPPPCFEEYRHVMSDHMTICHLYTLSGAMELSVATF